MTIFLCLLLAQSSTPSNVVVVGSDGSVNVMPPLTVDADAKPALQLASDWCDDPQRPGRETIIIPKGSWKVSSAWEIVSNVDIIAEGVTIETSADCVQSPVVGGAAGYAMGTRAKSDNVSITGLTIKNTTTFGGSTSCLFVPNGDNWRLTRFKVIGSRREGLYTDAYSVGWVLDRFEAEDCGSTGLSGINLNGKDHTLMECVARRCKQGYEHGGYRTTFLRCRAEACNVGWNLGNVNIGLYRPRLIDCVHVGAPNSDAVTVSNVNGRVGGVLIEGLDSTEGRVSFEGGKDANLVPQPDEGPDLERSIVRRSVVRTSSANGIKAFTYHCTESMNGRASIDFVDCVAEIPTGEPDWMPEAPFQVSGPITGDVVFLRPVVKGPRGASKAQGDFMLRPAAGVISMSNVKTLYGKAYKADGVERWFHPFREATE